MNRLATRRQEEKDRRREEILDAAAVVAVTHGMAAFTMEQVAQQARLSRALLYVYFTDKQDLLLGLADRAHAMLQQRFAVISKRKQLGIKKIQGMGRAYVSFAEDSPVYFEALACFAAHSAEAAEPEGNVLRCMQGGDLVHGELIQALEAGVQDGSIRADLGNPALVSVTLWGFMHGIIQIIATKGAMLEFKGVKSKQLVDQALLMCTRSLQSG
ncbi:MAG: TetR/AcrR family transcriptional regulator [Steroidobacteraceae bacterium]